MHDENGESAGLWNQPTPPFSSQGRWMNPNSTSSVLFDVHSSTSSASLFDGIGTTSYSLMDQQSCSTEAYYSTPSYKMAAMTANEGYDDLYSLNSHVEELEGNYLNPPSQQLLTDFDFPLDISSVHISNNYPDAVFPSPLNINNLPYSIPSCQMEDKIRSQTDHQSYDNKVINHIVEDKKRASSPPAMDEDGYNWRKYGQKQVKGSDYPRSYYKCTHSNCEVRKKVERAFDGYITEIIYKSNHNHPMPHPNRQLPPGSDFVQNEIHKGEESSSRVWRNMNSQSGEMSPGHDECFIPLDSAGTAEMSSPHHSPDAEDNDNEETDSKRRRIDDCMVEPNMASNSFHGNKIMVQVESEVDILDDGYRWRKYGQKVVKGNPNPRSYYKCTTAGCSVRKHVERDPKNIKDVITTYEGKHNHEVPTAKNISPNKSVGHLSSVQFQSSPMSITSSTSTMPKLEMTDQFSPPHLIWNLHPGSEYLSPDPLGNFGNGIHYGASSSMLNFPMTYNSYGPGMTTTSLYAQNLAVQRPLTLPGSISSSTTHFDFNNQNGPGGRQLVNPPDHHHDIDLRRIILKQEAKDEIFDSSSSSQVHLNKSSPLSSNYLQGSPSESYR